jgi:hypothetical protein
MNPQALETEHAARLATARKPPLPHNAFQGA